MAVAKSSIEWTESTWSPVRWLSMEPLLGPVDLGIGDPHKNHESDDVHGEPHPRSCLDCSTEDDEVRYFRREPDGGGIDWVVVGGESGHGARPMEPSWARSLRDECADAGVPFFFKQTGSVLAREWGLTGKGDAWDQLPAEFRIRDYPAVAHAA